MPYSQTASMGVARVPRQSSRPNGKKLSSPVKPIASIAAALLISGMLVMTIVLTGVNMTWITFLTGILVSALLAEATRVSKAEWALMRRTAQLSAAKDKMEKADRQRKALEKTIADSQSRLHLVDEILPTMVLYVDTEGRCRYHNRTFRDWLQFRREQIDGMHLNEVLGAKVYQEIAANVRLSLDGKKVEYRRNHKMPDGVVRKLAVEHFPQYVAGGKVTGFYMLVNDITEYADARASAAAAAKGTAQVLDRLSGQPGAQQDDAAAVMATAIERNEFRLFSQKIVPLAAEAGTAEFHEILVRLMEEEEGLIPPGAFFPLAEKLGMMSRLDRWVAQHVAEWIAIQFQQKVWPEGSVYFINLAAETLSDPGFADYVEVALKEYGIPGRALCFEMPTSDIAADAATVAGFAQRIRHCGAHVAISGFGHNGVEFDTIRGLQPDFLKIDGSALLAIPNDQAAYTKVAALNEVAKKMGVKTIAEMVESEAVLTRLKEIQVDYVQGFGISRPRPLVGRANEAPAREGKLMPLLAGA